MQRVEAVGRMAASLAHDFNNLLSPILGFAELTMADEELSSDHRRNLAQVMLAAERSRELTGRLLAFSRHKVLEPQPTNIGEAIAEAEGLLRTILREDTELLIHNSSTDCVVLADPAQLEQVLINLTNNAQDAMPRGGRLMIELGLREFDEQYRREHSLADSRQFAELVVSDSGEGMSPETIDRLFEPFFTTKGNYGTGLGLASVHGIVRQHGGEVLVYSEPGVGTTFKLYWPLTDEPVPIAASPETVIVSQTGASVMVVEDDDQVRDLVKQILTADGFDVNCASSGAEAKTWLAAAKRMPDLLLTDVILPDTNGRELAEIVRAHHPDLRVLYMSGYTDNVVVHNGVLDAGIDFLPKPFSVTELRQRVHAALT